MREPIPITIRLGGEPVPSSTLLTSAGANALVLSTTIPSPRAPVTLHSSFTGHRDSQTVVTHLLLARGIEPQLTTDTHPRGHLPVHADDRHACLYHHLQRLLADLRKLGHEPTIDVVDDAIEIIDR